MLYMFHGISIQVSDNLVLLSITLYETFYFAQSQFHFYFMLNLTPISQNILAITQGPIALLPACSSSVRQSSGSLGQCAPGKHHVPYPNPSTPTPTHTQTFNPRPYSYPNPSTPTPTHCLLIPSLTSGISRAHSSPPSLQLICRAIFWVTLLSFCCWEMVLLLITCTGEERDSLSNSIHSFIHSFYHSLIPSFMSF